MTRWKQICLSYGICWWKVQLFDDLTCIKLVVMFSGGAMRANKIAETFASAMNDMLTEGRHRESLEDGQTLKVINNILGAVAPGHELLTMRKVDGLLAGFSAKVFQVVPNDAEALVDDEDPE